MASYVTSNQFNKVTKAIENKTLFTKDKATLNIDNIKKINNEFNKYSFVDFLNDLSYENPLIELTCDLDKLDYEVGTTIPSCTLTAKITKGSSPIKKIEFYKNNNLESTITIDVENGGNFNYADGNPITTNTKYKVVITCIDGVLIEKELEINFYNAYYTGVIDKELSELLITDIISLSKEITKKEDKTYTYTANNLYCIFAYDASYGLIKSIKDENLFENIDSFNYKLLNVNGVDYYVYQTSSKVTCNNFKYTIKY